MSVEVNYDDKRFTEVEADKKAALAENDKLYGGMVSDSDKYFQDQIDASKDWADEQTRLQNERTDFAIQEIEQQKDQAKKDYTKEQSGAYVDWQKQSNEFGAEAEQRAAQGMANTGFSESSRVSMYNTYQNRVATARESYNRAVLNYNNAITEARLQNNSALAEIAYNALQQQLELSLQGFQYKNQLVLEQANKKIELEQMYHERWQDVLNQINTENSLAEQIRQFNESMALDKEQFEEQQRQFNESLALDKEQLAEQQRQFNYQNKLGEFASSGSSGGGGSGTISAATAKANQSKKSSESAKNTKNDSSDSSSGAALNLKSVVDAGYAGRSGETIANAVKSGDLVATQKGNQVYVSKNANKTASAGLQYTYYKGPALTVLNKNKK